jgi:hypothetical protein
MRFPRPVQQVGRRTVKSDSTPKIRDARKAASEGSPAESSRRRPPVGRRFLLNRPAPLPLASRHQLDPLIASAYTISRISALHLRSRINRFAVPLHGQHASCAHRVTQCGVLRRCAGPPGVTPRRNRETADQLPISRAKPSCAGAAAITPRANSLCNRAELTQTNSECSISVALR